MDYDYDAYDAQAGTINIDDITSDELNREILRRLKANCGELTKMWVCGEDERDTDDFDYCPTDAHDLGWLGYFIGQNTSLQHFQMGYLNGFDYDVQPLFRGICYNRSIEKLTFRCYDNMRGGDVFRTLAPFFKHNRSLTNVGLNMCNLGDEGCRLLSLALGGCNLVEHFYLYQCDVTDDQSVNIIEALGGHAQLKSIELNGNSVGRAGCAALAKVFQWENAELLKLDLGRNGIGDEGIEALVPALANSSNLRVLKLDGNTSITIKGFGALSSVLESPTSNLADLHIGPDNVCDEVLKMLASVLVNNSTLKLLQLNRNGIIDKGWSFLSQILCNASSINATYLSNHTLENIWWGHATTPDSDLNSLVALNGSVHQTKQIAMMKILKCHNNFDMQPLFEWDFKFLPCMIEWFEKAARCPYHYYFACFGAFEEMIQQRKLSAIYQFIRGMPLEFIEARSMYELKEVAARMKRLNSELEEMEKRKKRLRDELEEAKDLKGRILKSRTSR